MPVATLVWLCNEVQNNINLKKKKKFMSNGTRVSRPGLKAALHPGPTHLHCCSAFSTCGIRLMV